MILVLLVLAMAAQVPAREPAWLAQTWEAIHRHETANYRVYAKPREGAVGPGHCRPIMVRECNRIARLLGLRERFTLADRWSEEKSWRMFQLHSGWHRARNPEQAARLWHDGGDALRKGQGAHYWSRVKALMGLCKSSPRPSGDGRVPPAGMAGAAQPQAAGVSG